MSSNVQLLPVTTRKIPIARTAGHIATGADKVNDREACRRDRCRPARVTIERQTVRRTNKGEHVPSTVWHNLGTEWDRAANRLRLRQGRTTIILVLWGAALFLSSDLIGIAH